MENSFNKVKNYLMELEYNIIQEIRDEEIFIVEKQEAGITNLIIDCENPILIVELVLFELKNDNKEIFRSLLVKNREIVHGAFAIDKEGQKVIFRDTLQLENLDLNELQGTLNSLELLLSEYASEIIEFSKN